jgi:hypothetical protein
MLTGYSVIVGRFLASIVVILSGTLNAASSSVSPPKWTPLASASSGQLRGADGTMAGRRAGEQRAGRSPLRGGDPRRRRAGAESFVAPEAAHGEAETAVSPTIRGLAPGGGGLTLRSKRVTPASSEQLPRSQQMKRPNSRESAWRQGLA